METKPYSLQSPEQIAKDYGGNKQKIAEAMQMGIVDPTAGTLAGMFIDRMRSAQQQEMAPQQTVAQQVFAPPMPPMPAGLGATPQAAAMSPPPEMVGGAPMDAPPAPPMEAMPPQGMAMGGLTSLSLPDNMFDEPDNGGYASGGLVAFDAGGQARAPAEPEPDSYYGYNFRDPAANLTARDRLFGVPQTRYADEVEQDFLRRRGAEYRGEQRRKDLGQLMAEAGFGMMAGTSPNMFQNIGAAMIPALASATERARERRAEEREIQRGLLDIEAGRNTSAAQRATQALSMQEMGIRGYESETARRERRDEAERNRQFQIQDREDQQEFQRSMARFDGRGGGGGGGRGPREPQIDMAEANVAIPGGQGMPPTTIERFRARVRGTTDFVYIFPQLGNAYIAPAHGTYAVGVNNALRFAEHHGLGTSVGADGRLQFVGTNGQPRTISNRRIRQFEALGTSFNPANYTNMFERRRSNNR